MTGAGAIAIALFLVLQHYQPPPPAYKKGQLRGDLSKIADVRIVDEQPMYGYRDRTTSSIRFVLLDKKLKSSRLSLQVDTTEKGEGREFFELTGDADLIQKRYLSETADGDKQIQWTFDYGNRVVKDGHDVIFSERDSLEGALNSTQHAGILNPLLNGSFFLSVARAQSSGTAQPADVNDLIEKLKSDDASERRNARDTLSTQDYATIGPMMDAFRINSSNYRVRLGVLYSLDAMIRRSPDQRTEISAALKTEDFPLLVAAASDDDRTIRMQAANFLYLLQDPRAVPSSIEAARDASDNSKATNQILIIQQSTQQLPADAKAGVLNQLTRGQVNNDLVGQSGWARKKLGF